MPHLESQLVHRYVGDEVTIRATIAGLDAAQVSVAEWKAGSVVKTIAGGGITVSGTIPAIIDVQIDKADTDLLGAGNHEWQLAAGSVIPSVKAIGVLELEDRL